MKKVIFLLLAAIVGLSMPVYAEITRFPNGIGIGSRTDTDGASTTPGDDDIFIKGTVEADGAVDFDSTLNVEGAATLQSTLAMEGVATFTGQPILNGGLDVNEDVDIDFDASDEEFNLTTSSGGVTAAMTLYNSTADFGSSIHQWLLSLDLADDGNTYGNFLRCRDNAAANTMFSIGASGVVTLENSETIKNSTDDTVEVASNDEDIVLRVYAGTNAKDAIIDLVSDISTDNGDNWRIKNDDGDSNNLIFQNDTGGSLATKVTITDDGAATFGGNVVSNADVHANGNELYFTSSAAYLGYDTSNFEIDVSTELHLASGLIVGSNLIKASDGGTTITLDTSDNVIIAGDLSVDGGDIDFGDDIRKISAGTYKLDVSTDVDIAGDIEMEGGLFMRNDVAGQWNIDDASGNSLLQVTDAGATGNADISGTLNVTGASTLAATTIAGTGLTLNSFSVLSDSDTLTISSDTVNICTKAGAMEVDLPDAATSDGKIFTFKKTDAAASIIAIDANGGTIDGADPYNEIDAQYDFITIISDGTNWHIISKYITP